MCPAEGIEYNQLIKNIDYVWEKRKDLGKRLMELDKKMREEH